MPSQDNINYSVADRDLKYYIFDWDDNIMELDTKIVIFNEQTQQEEEVSTGDFADIQPKLGVGDGYENYTKDYADAFRNFRDTPGVARHDRDARGRLLQDEAAERRERERPQQAVARLGAGLGRGGHGAGPDERGRDHVKALGERPARLPPALRERHELFLRLLPLPARIVMTLVRTKRRLPSMPPWWTKLATSRERPGS